MSTKKPTPAQLAARKKFAAMAKNGTLAKKRKVAPKRKSVKETTKYLGFEIKKTKDVKGKTIYTTKTAIPPKSSILAAKKDIISHLVKGKVSVLKIASIKKKANSIKTLTQLKSEIKKASSTGLKKPQTKGLVTLCSKTVGTTGRRKKDGTLKKGYISTKGGKVVLKKKVVKKKVVKKK